MGLAKRFEDLAIWQRSRALCGDIYGLSAQKPFSNDFGLRDQVRRAALSVPLNIAEGFGRRSKKEFRRYLMIAHGSIAELQTCLYIAQDIEYIDRTTFENYYSEADEVSRMLSGFIRRLGMVN